MSIATDAAAEGFNVLLATSGEALGFRGGSVQAIVNRLSFESDPGPGKLDLNARDTSTIQVKWEDLPAHPRTATGVGNLPSPGEVFTDEFGYTHRVKKARRLGFRAHCECEVSST